MAKTKDTMLCEVRLTAWNNDLEDGISSEEWQEAISNLVKMSMSESHRITQLFYILGLLYT